jgi:hypothetical protein
VSAAIATSPPDPIIERLEDGAREVGNRATAGAANQVGILGTKMAMTR